MEGFGGMWLQKWDKNGRKWEGNGTKCPCFTVPFCAEGKYKSLRQEKLKEQAYTHTATKLTTSPNQDFGVWKMREMGGMGGQWGKWGGIPF